MLVRGTQRGVWVDEENLILDSDWLACNDRVAECGRCARGSEPGSTHQREAKNEKTRKESVWDGNCHV